MILSQLGVAVPGFWAGLLLILLFSVKLGWVQAGGFDGWGQGVWPAVKSLLLPAVALGLFQFAVLARTTRSAVLEVLREEYVKTARAKGVGEATRALPPHAAQRHDPHRHRGRHPARPAHGRQHHPGVGVLPARASAGSPSAPSAPGTCRWCRGWSCSWPRLIVMINVAVDILYGVLDPRIRYE